MTDFANLTLGIDSRPVKEGVAELDKLTAAGARAETAATDMAKAQAQAAAQISALKTELAAGRISQEQFIQKSTLVAQSLKGVQAAATTTAAAYTAMGNAAATGARATASATQQVSAVMKATTVSAGQLRAGTQQLSFQIGDVAQQFALGAPPMRIFAAQASQVVQAIGLMSNSTKGLIGFLSGPWGAVMLGAVTILGSLWAAHGKAAEGADTQAKASEDLTDAINDLHAAAVKETQSAYAQAQANLAVAETHRVRAVEARKAAIAELELAKSKAVGGQAVSGGPSYFSTFQVGATSKAQTEVDRLQKQIDRLNSDIGKSEGAIRLRQGQVVNMKLEEALDRGAAATGKFNRAQDALNKQLREGTISLDEYAQKSLAAMQTREREAEAAKKSTKAHKERKKGLTDEQRAYEQAKKATDNYIESLSLEIEKIGKNAAQIRAIEIAHAKEGAATDAQRKKIDELNIAREKALAITEAEQKAKERKKNDAALLDPVKEELALLGLTGEARDKAALKMEYESKLAQQLAGDLNLSKEALQAWYDTSLQIIEGESALEREANAARSLVEQMQAVDAQAQTTASLLSSAFGNFGSAIGGVLTAVTELQVREQEIADWKREEMKRAGNDAKRKAQIEITADRASKDAQVRGFGQVLGAAKTLFKEGTAGYKALEAAERAFAIIQLINTAKNVAAGAAKMFAMLGPFGFAAVGAMIAVMAALGFRGGGGSSGSAPTSAADLQAAQGTGTVLGDPTGKSESIARSLELVAANTNEMLEYDNAMLRSLRAIETGIEKLAASIAAELSLPGGAFDQDKLGLGTTSKSGFLGLFGSSTTKTLYDQGVEFFSTSLADAISGGLTGQTYQIVEKVKKKSGFLGIGGGTKTSYITTTQGIDPAISGQIGLILGSIRDSVIEAAKVLGLNVSAALDQFQVEIGKISFKDMSADEISQTLSAVFSKVADQMAGFAVEGLEEFQKAGEGLFETLLRLAKDYVTIDTSLKSIGKTFGMVGAESIALRENLIDLFGSLEEFVDQVAFYQANFLTEAEQIAPIRASVEAELARLGLSYVDTRTEFNAVVQSLDLTTTAGQELFAALMALAPAFDAVEQYEEQAAQRALELARQKASMEIQLLELQGNAVEALAKKRQMELAALDPSLRALQEEIYAAQDIASAKNKLIEAYKRERSELEQTISKFGDLAKSLRAYRDTLFGGGTNSVGYNAALTKLMATGSLASAGDATALGDLQGVSKTFLDVAKDRASTLQQYQRDVALVAQYVDQGIAAAEGQMTTAEKQLAAMETQVGALVDINTSVLSVKDAILQLNALLGPSGTPPAPGTPSTGGRTRRTREERQEERNNRLEQKMDRLIAATEQSTISANQTARYLRDWDRGGSLAVATDDDTPLATTVAA